MDDVAVNVLTVWVEKSESVVSIVRECGPRERERWNRGDESCKLAIYLS